MKKRILFFWLLCSLSTTLMSQQVVHLWPDGAPNSNGITAPEGLTENGRITNVTDPTLTVFPAAKPNSMAVIALPGGAYIRLAIHHEGLDMAPWFNSQGITYAVLKYRMPNGKIEVPLSDALRAIELMREHAAEWNVNPRQVGIMGSSAGGNLAAMASTHFTSDANRPDFQILFYPFVGMNKFMARTMLGEDASEQRMDEYNVLKHVSAQTPPAFILCSADDKTVPCSNSTDYFHALRKLGIKAAVHVYPSGGHGWGFKDDFPYKRQWMSEMEQWLKQLFPDNDFRRWGRNVPRRTDSAYYKTAEARRIGDNVLLWQRVTGGWPKNEPMAKPLSAEEKAKVLKDKNRRDDSTTDNDATNTQIYFLARLYQQTQDPRYKEGVRKGIDYLLSGQYKNGGWPQFWPGQRDYQDEITYNDDAMANTMLVLRDVFQSKAPFDGDLIDKATLKRAQIAFNKGIDCILATQLHDKEGNLAIWCQQYDAKTLQPAKARAFELPSYTPQESVPLIELLMAITNPDKRVKKAIHGAMRWIDTYKLTGLRLERTRKDGMANTRLAKDSKAGPLWARYYDLDNTQPFVCDRDGVPRRHLEDIGPERRNGYSWFDDKPASLYKEYDQWADKYDPHNKIAIDLSSPGANATGLVDMDRRPQPDEKRFDAVVDRGGSIQQVLEQAPDNSAKPYTILVKKGIYHEKVIIDKPNIVLVGEDKDSVIIVGAEAGRYRMLKEYKGKPVGAGIVLLTEKANDCVISGVTVINNYGTTVQPTTTHQFAVFGKATRTIIINSNIISDGNDALSLWGQNGDYYHSDLYISCRGVDFICPRGTCYATRCRFYGDTRAILWHDGRADKQNKFVVTNSWFDARQPTPLGRYHHDSQFYIINCRLSHNILDENIEHAYKREPELAVKYHSQIDPCPWGKRVYYYGTTREGGDSGWLKNNLSEAEGAPAFYAITAKWTFLGRWDPEQRISDLWPWLAY